VGQKKRKKKENYAHGLVTARIEQQTQDDGLLIAGASTHHHSQEDDVLVSSNTNSPTFSDSPQYSQKARKDKNLHMKSS